MGKISYRDQILKKHKLTETKIEKTRTNMD